MERGAGECVSVVTRADTWDVVAVWLDASGEIGVFWD